jgi:CheY-like chemotaxis protein
LEWELTPGMLALKWTEIGGPPTQAPSSPGFGTRIITASVEGQLAGKAVFDWRPEGLQCVLSVPREDMTPVKGRNGKAVPDVSVKPIAVAGNRIMIVEDEALVALALRESLDEMGFSVLGPFNRISEAMVALRNNRVDAAVLDVNLGGELIYPLADVLAADRVPFVFITGYGAEEIEPRYAKVPILQKPIEPGALQSVLVRPGLSPAVVTDPAHRMVG